MTRRWFGPRTMALGVATAIAAIVGVSAVPGVGDGAGRTSIQSGPREVVLNERDALPARKGIDYQVVARLDRATSPSVVDVTPDGDLVLVSGDYSYQLSTVDTSTGERQALPSLWKTGTYPRIARVTARRLDAAWVTSRAVHVASYDRVSGEAREVTVDGVPGRYRNLANVSVTDGGRIWFTSVLRSGEGQRTEAVLWVSSLAQPTRVRKVFDGRPIAGYAVTDEVLAYVPYRNNDGPHTVFIRDLRHAKETTVHYSDCDVAGTLHAAERSVVADASCDERPYFRTLVMRADGSKVAQLDLGDRQVGSMGRRWVTFADFAFDLRDRRLLRVSDIGFEAGELPATGGDYVVWPTGRRPRPSDSSFLALIR